MNISFYDKKSDQYFRHLRSDIIALLDGRTDLRVLEVGAAGGTTLDYLKSQNIASEIMGFDLMQVPDSFQSASAMSRFQVGNIETDEIESQEEYFDVIICADVLEHLSDPWTVLKKLKNYLKPGGEMIISLPNVREIGVMASLLFKARFRYKEEGGIMDKTHLRFFCKKDMLDMISAAGFTTTYAAPGFMSPAVKSWKRKFLNRISLGVFQDILTIQYLFIAKKEK